MRTGIQPQRNKEAITGRKPISGSLAASRANERRAQGMHQTSAFPRIIARRREEIANGIRSKKLETNDVNGTPAGQNSAR